MATQLLYLHNTYQYQSTAKLLAKGKDEKGNYLLFDKTIFYPQGGGQPSDTGWIKQDAIEVPVHFVKFVQGAVRHYVTEEYLVENELTIGKEIGLQINGNQRLSYAKLHTAGHLIGNVVSECLGENLRAVKGYHFAQGSYVEFIGQKPVNIPDFLLLLNKKLTEICQKQLTVKAELIDYVTLQQKCNYLPKNLPTDKPLRVVTIGSFEPIPCGGTHVRNLAELSKVVVRKVKSKKDKIRFSYQVN